MLSDGREFEPELIARGFRRVTYVELYCSQDGCLRIGLEEGTVDDDVEQFPCPNCGQQRPGAVIGSGFTTRSVPLIEMIHAPLDNQEVERRRRGIKIGRRQKACVKSFAIALS